MRKMFPFLLAAALLTGCSGGSETAELTNANSVDIVGDTLTLSPTSNIAPRLVYGIVSDTAFTATLTTTGVVTAIPSSYAEVAARLEISPKTVDAQLQKAVKHLRAVVGSYLERETSATPHPMRSLILSMLCL